MPAPSLTHSIFKTLAYFDLFNYPLTKEELYRWLWQFAARLDYKDFIKDLDRLAQAQAINCKHGYYFLPGRAATVRARQQKITLIEQKMKIARRGAKKIRWIPFVRAVFVANTVAAGTATAPSDIDVLVVVKPGRLYLARLLATLLLTVFRLRRHKKRVANRICLCFYVTSDALDLSKIKMGEPDIYLCYWIDQLVPLYDPANTRAALIMANHWIRSYLPPVLNDYALLSRWRVADSRGSKLFKKFLEIAWRGAYGDSLETQSKKIQQAKMKLNYASLQNAPDSRVVISDTMLKFHENDRREEYRQAWQKRCQLTKYV